MRVIVRRVALWPSLLLLYRSVRIQRHFDLIEIFEDTLPRLHIFFFKKQLSDDRF